MTDGQFTFLMRLIDSRDLSMEALDRADRWVCSLFRLPTAMEFDIEYDNLIAWLGEHGIRKPYHGKQR